MDKFSINTFLIKLTSRKLWVAIIGAIIFFMQSQGYSEGSIESVLMIVGGILSLVSYVIAEGAKDAAAAKPKLADVLTVIQNIIAEMQSVDGKEDVREVIKEVAEGCSKSKTLP